MSTQPCTLRGIIPLSLEGVLDQDSILAFGARGKQGDRTTHEFLNPSDIFDGLGRQIGPGSGMGGRLFPTLDGLIDRLDAGLCSLSRRQVVDVPAIEPIPRAHLYRVETVENVELGQRQPVNATGPHRLSDENGVEPATTARAAGIGAELAAALANLPAGLVVLLGWERPLPDPRGVGLANAQDIANRARAHPGSRSRLGRHSVGRRHIGIGAVIDIEQGTLRTLEQDALALTALEIEQPPHGFRVGQEFRRYRAQFPENTGTVNLFEI